MITKQNKNEIRQKRHLRIRSHISGTPSRPRLCVYRSTNHIYAQIIDDVAAKTLVSYSDIARDFDGKDLSKTEAAVKVGKVIAERAKAAGIEVVVFDRGGYLYTGRVKALADGAREAGLQF